MYENIYDENLVMLLINHIDVMVNVLKSIPTDRPILNSLNEYKRAEAFINEFCPLSLSAPAGKKSFIRSG